MRALFIGASLLGACTFEPPQIENVAAAEQLASEVEAENLMPWVERLASDHLADRKHDCVDYPAEEDYPSCELSSQAAISLVHRAFAQLGYQTSIRTLGTPGAPRNVVADLRGTTREHEVVLVGAHVDAFYAGADDNSSGVAAMLELARVAAEHRFARSIRFVGFDLEERGSLGSTRFVESGQADDVVAALILESIGFSDKTPGSQDSPLGLELGDKGDSLLIAGNAASRGIAQQLFAINSALDLMTLRAVIAGGDGAFPLSGALLRSDNGPFWLRDQPAVMLTDSANFRNPHYHHASDTPDTLDPELLAGTTRLVAAALAVMAEVEP